MIFEILQRRPTACLFGSEPPETVKFALNSGLWHRGHPEALRCSQSLRVLSVLSRTMRAHL